MDAIVAATALAHDLIVWTPDEDFDVLAELIRFFASREAGTLQVVNPGAIDPAVRHRHTGFRAWPAIASRATIVATALLCTAAALASVPVQAATGAQPRRAPSPRPTPAVSLGKRRQVDAARRLPADGREAAPPPR
jgi:hypothetical protein